MQVFCIYSSYANDITYINKPLYFFLFSRRQQRTLFKYEQAYNYSAHNCDFDDNFSALSHFAYSHMATGETLSQGQAIFRCFTECIFIISAFVHTSVSFSKALTTLGVINSSKAAKIIDKVVYTVCTVAALAALYAVLRFFGGDII